VLCWKSDLTFGDMLLRTTLPIDASFRDVKGVSMETITILAEITEKVLFHNLRTEALRL